MTQIALTEIDIVRENGMIFDHWSEKKTPAQHPVSAAETAPAGREPKPLRTPTVTTPQMTESNIVRKKGMPFDHWSEKKTPAHHPVSTAESAPAGREPKPLRSPTVTTPQATPHQAALAVSNTFRTTTVTTPHATTHKTALIVLTTLRTVTVTTPQATTRQTVLVVSNTLRPATVTTPQATTPKTALTVSTTLRTVTVTTSIRYAFLDIARNHFLRLSVFIFNKQWWFIEISNWINFLVFSFSK
jgi:hypothetical protein